MLSWRFKLINCFFLLPLFHCEKKRNNGKKKAHARYAKQLWMKAKLNCEKVRQNNEAKMLVKRLGLQFYDIFIFFVVSAVVIVVQVLMVTVLVCRLPGHLDGKSYKCDEREFLC